jgi:hypothetical protein
MTVWYTRQGLGGLRLTSEYVNDVVSPSTYRRRFFNIRKA